ncbi:MAG: DUF2059 domain-containing protein [Candidatus Omnitrophota bacterium]|nr:DUF2059 domain-containing protein [Candidatus Omnitrophota bacterium]MDZ4241717.1 DUF2059 domain-containing protein [Candidatus Omnitrophota bacterium]
MLKSRFGVFGLLVLVSMWGAAPAQAQELKPVADEAKLQDIRKLMNLTGGGDLGRQIMTQMIESFKANAPDVPAEFWDEFLKEADANALIELNVPIYDKYLSHEEVKGLIGFYESPVGKKFIEVLPKIAEDSYMAGEKWGYDLGMKIRQKLIEKGYFKDVEGESGVSAETPATVDAPVPANP